MKTDSLGDRMKAYEDAYRIYFPRRLPVIIRVDGRAFHTFTRGFEKPFDWVFMASMQETALNLCSSVAGCKLAYVQSDEISLLVTNDDTIETQPWFGNGLQKLTSITASIATLAFNRAFERISDAWCLEDFLLTPEEHEEEMKYERKRRVLVYQNVTYSATFDSRAFVIPKDEVANYFIWRQQDAIRNSIQSSAQSLYSHKELQGKNSSQLQEMIAQKGVNWDSYSVDCQRGACVVPETSRGWRIDRDIPIFTQNREYIEGRMP